jgi:group I intron endonuclease
MITNLVNLNCYIGQSNNIHRRFMEYRTPKYQFKNSQGSISLAFRKYGIWSFRFDVIEHCSIEQLDIREIYWIALLLPEYNRNKGGRGNSRPVSEETKMILKEKGKAQWNAKSGIEKIIQIRNNLTSRRKKGYVMRPESKAKMSANHKGKTNISKETYQIISLKNSIKLKGNSNGNKSVAYYEGGKLIGTFPSAKLASDNFGVHPSCITGVLKGRRKTTCGYTWRYL